MSAGPGALKAAVEAAEASLAGESRRLHYLSVPPAGALPAVRLLAEAGLVERSLVIMEKPFGTDLASAVSLNARLHEVFTEEQIFRIDHFLGKEAAQNILAFRFANGLFEPIWNRNFIDHVQIDVPETLGLGARSGFYEATGAFRDMVVTHLFQILAFVAMEAPTSLEPAPISEEKNKVFRSLSVIEPGNVVRGQYVGYRSEAGVDPESDTETFIALKCGIDNWRWAGVPFFLRTGKRLAEGQRIISLAFRNRPRACFPRAPASARRDRITSPSTSRTPQGVLVLLWQAPWSGHAAGQVEHAICDARYRLDRRRPRGLRAPDPGCNARRPHAVHHRRGHRAPVGSVDPAARLAAARPALPAGFVGTEIDPPTHRPPCLAPAFREGLAGPQSRGRLKHGRRSQRGQPGRARATIRTDGYSSPYRAVPGLTIAQLRRKHDPDECLDVPALSLSHDVTDRG